MRHNSRVDEGCLVTNQFPEPMSLESDVIYAPNYVCTFDFVPRQINRVFGASHKTRVSHISSRIPIICVHIYTVAFFFPVLPFRLDLFQSRAQPQTFRQIPNETNDQHGRKHVLLEYMAIFLCFDTSCEILSQHTFIISRTLLIFSLLP